jgi:hypothetical protein
LNVKPFGGPLELRQVHEERRRDYPTSDSLINFVPDSRRFPEGLFGVFVCLNHCFGTLSRNKRLRPPKSTPFYHLVRVAIYVYLLGLTTTPSLNTGNPVTAEPCNYQEWLP